MKNGDVVTVYPHGKPEETALAYVLLVSSNQRSVALAFQDKPPFAIWKDDAPTAVRMAVSRWGLTMLATREAIDDQPIGPWIETFGGGHYEIEESQ